VRTLSFDLLIEQGLTFVNLAYLQTFGLSRPDGGSERFGVVINASSNHIGMNINSGDENAYINETQYFTAPVTFNQWIHLDVELDLGAAPSYSLWIDGQNKFNHIPIANVDGGRPPMQTIGELRFGYTFQQPSTTVSLYRIDNVLLR
jgi:hypothetical protein